MSVIARTTTRGGTPVEIIHVAPAEAAWAGGQRIAGIMNITSVFGQSPEVRLWTIAGKTLQTVSAEDDLVIPPEWNLDAMAGMIAISREEAFGGVFGGVSLLEAAYGPDRSKWPLSDSWVAETPKKPPAPSVAERRAAPGDVNAPAVEEGQSAGFGMDRAPLGRGSTLGDAQQASQAPANQQHPWAAVQSPDPLASFAIGAGAPFPPLTRPNHLAKRIADHAAGRREVLGELAGKVLVQFEGQIANNSTWEVDPSDILVLRAALEESGMLPKPVDPQVRLQQQDAKMVKAEVLAGQGSPP